MPLRAVSTVLQGGETTNSRMTRTDVEIEAVMLNRPIKISMHQPMRFRVWQYNVLVV
jgi:hypothetical protein